MVNQNFAKTAGFRSAGHICISSFDFRYSRIFCISIVFLTILCIPDYSYEHLLSATDIKCFFTQLNDCTELKVKSQDVMFSLE